MARRRFSSATRRRPQGGPEAPRPHSRFATIGSDLALVLTGPVDVTQRLFARTGMTMKDIDLVEINEAFSSVVLRYIQAFDIDPRR